MVNRVGIDMGEGWKAEQVRAMGGNWDNCSRITILRKGKKEAKNK